MLESNIMVLGERGYGKTCALASMYRVLSTIGMEGYQLQVRDAFSEQGRAQRRLLNGLSEGIAQAGELPDASTVGTAFHFYFTYGMVPLMAINWLDYPGNLITGSDGNLDSEQYEQFTDALLAADLVILCIPVTELMTVDIFDNTVLQAYYGLITEALGRLEKDDNKFSIGFMVTKADEYGNRDEMQNRLMKLIEASSFCKAKSDHWNVFGFYTTLGWRLRFMSSADGKETKRIDPATYEPEGFEMPVFLAAMSSVKNKKQRVERQIMKLEREISANQDAIAEKKRTWMYSLFHYGKDMIISRQEAIEELNKQIRTFDGDYKKNKERFDRMIKILDDAEPLAYNSGARLAIRNIYD